MPAQLADYFKTYSISQQPTPCPSSKQAYVPIHPSIQKPICPRACLLISINHKQVLNQQLKRDLICYCRRTNLEAYIPYSRCILYRISVQMWEHIIQLLYKSLQACTNSECVEQIEESPDSESCEAHVPCVHIQSPAAATSRQDMEDMDIWAGRHGQWAEEGEWGVSYRQAVLLRCLGGLGFLAPGQTTRYHYTDRLLAAAGSWTKHCQKNQWALFHGLGYMGYVVWMLTKECLVI